jgi:hypothetical protein
MFEVVGRIVVYGLGIVIIVLGAAAIWTAVGLVLTGSICAPIGGRGC